MAKRVTKDEFNTIRLKLKNGMRVVECAQEHSRNKATIYNIKRAGNYLEYLEAMRLREARRTHKNKRTSVWQKIKNFFQ